MTSIDYQHGKAACPKCGGMLAYDASVKDRLPLGFGFGATGQFQVDYVERQGWRGECMECGGKVFAVASRRTITRLPKSINRKLREDARRAAEGQP